MRRVRPPFAPAFVAAILLCGSAVQPVTAQSSAEKVVGGPYVINVGPRSATVMWVVQDGEASLGTTPGKMDKSAPMLHAKSVYFTGLKAGSTYYYDSFGGEAGKGSFKTPPAEASQFDFVVFGDTRTRHDVHRAVVAAILKNSNPDFVVHTGDLVADGDDTSLWPIFFDAEREMLRKTAFFPVLGNHERNSRNYRDFMTPKPYYSFNWGSVHVTVINSDIANAAPTKVERDAFWQEQTRWLEADLQASQKADFRFFVAHHPPITAAKSRQNENQHMTALEPMLEKYHVTAGFFGHDHNYQHYLKNGVHYFVTGGGGAPLYDVDAAPAGITQKVAKTENFVVVKVNHNKARIEAFTPAGETIDVTEVGGVPATAATRN